MSGPGKHIKAAEAARLLGILPREVRKKIKRGQLRGHLVSCDGRAGKRMMVDLASLPVEAQQRHQEHQASAAAAHTPKESPQVDLWASVSQKEREAAVRREQTLKTWRHYLAAHDTGRNQTALTNEFLAQLGQDRPSRATLYIWDARYRADGLAGLLPRWYGGAESSLSPWAKDRFNQLYLDQRKRSARICFEVVVAEAKDHGERVPGYSAFLAHTKSIPDAVKVLYREGQRAYRAKVEPPITRDHTTYRVNEEWHADHCQLDVFAVGRSGKICRPWKTEWFDLRSRRIVASVISEGPPNVEVVLYSLGIAIKRHGVPEWVRFDNGRDFKALSVSGRGRWWKLELSRAEQDRMHGALRLLGISVSFTTPKNPRSHGGLERKFRTDRQRFDCNISTWCGESPKVRPEDIKDRMRSGIPTVTELQDLNRAYLEKDYNERQHGGQGMDRHSPREVYEAHLASKRTVAEAELRLCLWKSTNPLVIHKTGVQLFGRWYRWDGYTMRLGARVYARYDPEQLGRIWLFDEHDREIGPAECTHLMAAGATEKDWREVKRQKRLERKLAIDYANLRKATRDEPDPWRRHLDEKPDPPPDKHPQVIEPIRTPLRAAAKRVAAAAAADTQTGDGRPETDIDAIPRRRAVGEVPGWMESLSSETRDPFEPDPD